MSRVNVVHVVHVCAGHSPDETTVSVVFDPADRAHQSDDEAKRSYEEDANALLDALRRAAPFGTVLRLARLLAPLAGERLDASKGLISETEKLTGFGGPLRIRIRIPRDSFGDNVDEEDRERFLAYVETRIEGHYLNVLCEASLDDVLKTTVEAPEPVRPAEVIEKVGSLWSEWLTL